MRSARTAIDVDHLIVTMPSVVFDAVLVPDGSASIATLKGSGDAVQFVREAFKHAKPIAAIGDGADFLSGAGLIASGSGLPVGVRTGTDPAALATGFTADVEMHRLWDRPVKGVAA